MNCRNINIEETQSDEMLRKSREKLFWYVIFFRLVKNCYYCAKICCIPLKERKLLPNFANRLYIVFDFRQELFIVYFLFIVIAHF